LFHLEDLIPFYSLYECALYILVGWLVDHFAYDHTISIICCGIRRSHTVSRSTPDFVLYCCWYSDCYCWWWTCSSKWVDVMRILNSPGWVGWLSRWRLCDLFVFGYLWLSYVCSSWLAIFNIKTFLPIFLLPSLSFSFSFSLTTPHHRSPQR